MRHFGIIPFLMLSLLALWQCVSAEEHAVEKGETALQIAIDHDLTMDQLSRLNPGVDLEMMKIGDILIVPDKDTPSFEEFLNRRYADLIRITDLDCTAAADRSAGCLFHAENLSDLPLFDVQLNASVRGKNGASGQADGKISLMQILPGEKLPVYISVQGDFSEVEQASVSVRNLSYSEMLQSSFRIGAELYTQTDTLTADGIGAASAIRFNADGIKACRDKKINIQSAAYDEEGKLTGVRSLYSDFFPRLDITVYSGGSAIRSVVVRMEAY